MLKRKCVRKPVSPYRSHCYEYKGHDREKHTQGQAGDAEDDCIGRALGFQSRLSERLPQRHFRVYRVQGYLYRLDNCRVLGCYFEGVRQ